MAMQHEDAGSSIVPGLRVILCQGAGCSRRIFLSDVAGTARAAKQRVRDAGWRLQINGGYCPSCKAGSGKLGKRGEQRMNGAWTLILELYGVLAIAIILFVVAAMCAKGWRAWQTSAWQDDWRRYFESFDSEEDPEELDAFDAVEMEAEAEAEDAPPMQPPAAVVEGAVELPDWALMVLPNGAVFEKWQVDKMEQVRARHLATPEKDR